MRSNPIPTVLIVDDEVDLAQTLRANLLADGYRVEVAYTGDDALAAVEQQDFDLLILDVMLPGLDGFSICETVRNRGSAVPILFLTARTGSDARVQGLEAGGDDYLEKPFSLRELMLRVEALVHRGNGGGDKRPTIRFGDNRLDLATGGATTWDGSEVRLGGAELGVLRTLVAHEGEAVGADEILEEVWRDDVFPSSRVVRRLVERLVSRFEPDPSLPRHFLALPGQQFSFVRETREH